MKEDTADTVSLIERILEDTTVKKPEIEEILIKLSEMYLFLLEISKVRDKLIDAFVEHKYSKIEELIAQHKEITNNLGNEIVAAYIDESMTVLWDRIATKINSNRKDYYSKLENLVTAFRGQNNKDESV